jgi:hypothetical protein
MGKRRISGGAISRVKRPRLAKRTTTQRPPEVIKIPSTTPSPTLAEPHHVETSPNYNSSCAGGDGSTQNAPSTIAYHSIWL